MYSFQCISNMCSSVTYFCIIQNKRHATTNQTYTSFLQPMNSDLRPFREKTDNVPFDLFSTIGIAQFRNARIWYDHPQRSDWNKQKLASRIKLFCACLSISWKQYCPGGAPQTCAPFMEDIACSLCQKGYLLPRKLQTGKRRNVVTILNLFNRLQGAVQWCWSTLENIERQYNDFAKK